MRPSDGGGEVVSAVPDALMGYSNIATPNNQSLQGYARAASDAIQNFLRSNPDPLVMPGITDVGAEAAAYASQKLDLDKWVFDVGLAFLTVAEQNLPPSVARDYPYGSDLGQTVVTPPGGEPELQSALTNNALTAEAKRDADNLSRLLQPNLNPLQYRDLFVQLANVIQVYGNDPVQLAAFFQSLGAKNTLLVIQYLNVLDPQSVPAFASAFATATNSPTWDGGFDTTLTQDAIFAGPLGPQGNPIQPGDLSLLLQNGVFPSGFLNHVGDLLFQNPKHIEPEGAGTVIPAFLQALARNPQAAYSYLMGSFPPGSGTHQDGVPRILELDVMRWGDSSGPAYDSWMAALGQATLAANTWAESRAPTADGGPPPDASLTLLKVLSYSTWQYVPNSYRSTVLQVISQHIGSFVNIGGAGELTQEEVQNLLALALTDDMGSANKDRVTAFQDAIANWVGIHTRIPDTSDPTAMVQWINEVSQLSALPLLGENVGLDAYDKAREQQAAFIELLFTVALAYQPELEPEALGLTAAETKLLRGVLDFTELKETGPAQDKLFNLFFPDADAQVRDEIEGNVNAEGELLVASLLYARNPAWLAGSPDPATARRQIADLVKIANSRQTGPKLFHEQEKAFQEKYPQYSLDQISKLLTPLEAAGGQYAKDARPEGGN